MFEDAMNSHFVQEDFEKYFFTVGCRSCSLSAPIALFAVKIFHLQFCAPPYPEEELIVSLSFAFLRLATHFTPARSS
jgi:hypothetical protein